ncbi:MAG: NADH-quinone oxidoreductase subunit C [Bacteroidota bacterium]|nr:NADH-quinone oxidoreductase subunit C [Bacteroidota bacterium]
MTQTATELVPHIQSLLGNDLLDAYLSYDMTTLVVKSNAVINALKTLKEDEKLDFHFMTDLCGVHYPTNKGLELGVVYHLHNFKTNIRIRIETFFSELDPRLETATTLWPAANWMERETYDFYGIIFEGHPDLRRILNMDDLGMFPMLKYNPLEDQTRTDKNDKMFGR